MDWKNLRRGSLVALAWMYFPVACPGASREMEEMQRQVAILDERVQTMQRSLDQKLAVLETLAKQTLKQAEDASTAQALVQDTLEKRADRQNDLAVPLAAVGANVSRLSQELRAIPYSLSDVMERLERIEQRLDNVETAMRVIQAPPAPPPGEEKSGSGQ